MRRGERGRIGKRVSLSLSCTTVLCTIPLSYPLPYHTIIPHNPIQSPPSTEQPSYNSPHRHYRPATLHKLPKHLRHPHQTAPLILLMPCISLVTRTNHCHDRMELTAPRHPRRRRDGMFCLARPVERDAPLHRDLHILNRQHERRASHMR